ncbi:hypothetical protein CEXT_381741 [Caerostris extrusa]|uniref:Uncharacterized protein n=1 Tax=Caerostris extrusa TaxID=172846 RepID=A0AAV4WHP5_CAEEX|nr:hypothetical protein CEXT_381741 [Caerostris extrusa]
MKVSLFRENQPKPRSDDQAKDIPSIKLGFYYVKLMQRPVDAFITSSSTPSFFPPPSIPKEHLINDYPKEERSGIPFPAFFPLSRFVPRWNLPGNADESFAIELGGGMP